MKNFISLLIITFSLLIISNVENYASCPTGFTSKVVTVPYLGCTYTFEICYKCDVTAPGPVIMFDETYQRISQNCTSNDWDEAIPALREYISSGQFVFNELCFWGDPGPCDVQFPLEPDYVYMTYKYYFCFEEYDGPDKVRPCDLDNYCEVTWKYCANSNGTFAKVLDDYILVGEIPSLYECPIFEMRNGGCFKVSSLCNP